jgi:serine phosphatase RsbU (regulator of sigma subunit)
VPIGAAGLPIGMIEDATFDPQTAVLRPGDRLYFYSDGLIEAQDDSEQPFGETRLAEEFARRRSRPLGEGLDEVADLVQDWSGGCLTDDVSLLAVELDRDRH